MPNLTNRFLEGNGTGYIEPGLPNITGGAGYKMDSNMPSCYGAFKQSSSSLGNLTNSTSKTDKYLEFDASLSNQIYGKSNTVQPATCKAYFVIRY